MGPRHAGSTLTAALLPYMTLCRSPAGYKIPPTSHPRPELGTVISRAFHVGMGETADAAKAWRLPAGSYFSFDPGMNHYAHVEEESVVQLSSVGPWAINYVNKADDPRTK